MGGVIHADDLYTTTASSDFVSRQDEVISSFASNTCLKLNQTKFEIVQISPYSHSTSVVQIGDTSVSTLTIQSVLVYG